jgi:uncharacterized membrane protein (Fun14 family)
VSSLLRGIKKAMIIDNLTSMFATIGGGFFGGLLIGHAFKKVVRLVAIVVGLFIAGLAYLQYQQLKKLSTGIILEVQLQH